MPYAFRDFIADRISPGVMIVTQELPLKVAIDELLLI
jgi:hypothetical protein